MSTWQRVNRRWLQHDIYMPATISETMGRMVVAVDTSGSISGDILTKFLSEVQAIAIAVKPEKLDLIYWDTEVARHEMYTQQDLDKLVGSTKPAGGGGTDVLCVPKYLKDNQIRPECVVVLTDGDLYSGWGKWDAPVLWCITSNKSAKPTCGVAIYMD
jgi:predicted metal-dependent peptidase